MASLPTQVYSSFMKIRDLKDISFPLYNSLLITEPNKDNLIYGIDVINYDNDVEKIKLFISVDGDTGSLINFDINVSKPGYLPELWAHTVNSLFDENNTLSKTLTRVDEFGNKFLLVPNGFSLKAAYFEDIPPTSPSSTKIVCWGFCK